MSYFDTNHSFYKELVNIRHHIHRHPELSNEEFETTKFLKSKLTDWGVRIAPTSLPTGVIAEIGDAAKGPVIALRADIDALPILEKTNLSYASVNEGKMHACGHDFHQTSLLGAAYLLKQQEEELKGLVRLIFQPAEENHQGGKAVIAAGHLQNVEKIIGFHNHPGYPTGTIALVEGGIMAAVDQFMVKVKGIGSHAADPHLGVDTIVTMTAMIQQVQSIVSRNTNPRDPLVVSVTHVEAGNTWNVLPDEGFFEGTIRSFSKEARAHAVKRFYEIVENVAKAYGSKVEIEWLEGPNVTYNHPELTSKVFQHSQTFTNVVEATPSNAGEDFAAFQEKIPGVFAFIGSNGDENAPGWHHSDFLVKDEGLPTAVNYYVENAKYLLTEN